MEFQQLVGTIKKSPPKGGWKAAPLLDCQQLLLSSLAIKPSRSGLSNLSHLIKFQYTMFSAKPEPVSMET